MNTEAGGLIQGYFERESRFKSDAEVIFEVSVVTDANHMERIGMQTLVRVLILLSAMMIWNYNALAVVGQGDIHKLL